MTNFDDNWKSIIAFCIYRFTKNMFLPNDSKCGSTPTTAPSGNF